MTRNAEPTGPAASRPRTNRIARGACGAGVAASFALVLWALGEAAVSGASTVPPTFRRPFRVLTFNAGTTTGLPHDLGPDDGYGRDEAEIADALYENSLSWNPAERALTRFLAETRPEIAFFQELYFDPWCETIPVDPALDFVCREYAPDRPLQIERLLGGDYQVACAADQEDNCAGVRRDFGRFVGCPDAGPCLGGLAGTGPPDGCSRGARVGSAEIELSDGTRVTLVGAHGTSGFTGKDMDCRVSQFAQIFVDRGDGEPAASGAVNLVLGDLNTDPFLLGCLDPSAAFWNEWVGPGRGFDFVDAEAASLPPSYFGVVRIDHVASDRIRGRCFVPGGSPGVPPVIDTVYWDHRPVLCDVAM